MASRFFLLAFPFVAGPCSIVWPLLHVVRSTVLPPIPLQDVALVAPDGGHIISADLKRPPDQRGCEDRDQGWPACPLGARSGHEATMEAGEATHRGKSAGARQKPERVA